MPRTEIRHLHRTHFLTPYHHHCGFFFQANDFYHLLLPEAEQPSARTPQDSPLLDSCNLYLSLPPLGNNVIICRLQASAAFRLLTLWRRRLLVGQRKGDFGLDLGCVSKLFRDL